MQANLSIYFSHSCISIGSVHFGIFSFPISFIFAHINAIVVGFNHYFQSFQHKMNVNFVEKTIKFKYWAFE